MSTINILRDIAIPEHALSLTILRGYTHAHTHTHKHTHIHTHTNTYTYIHTHARDQRYVAAVFVSKNNRTKFPKKIWQAVGYKNLGLQNR